MKTHNLKPDALFRAFGEATRLRLLHLLSDGPQCVGDLVTALRVPQPTVSRHLAYLRRSGLVLAERRQLWTFYKLNLSHTPLQKTILACLKTCPSEAEELQTDLLRLKSLHLQGTTCCPPKTTSPSSQQNNLVQLNHCKQQEKIAKFWNS